MTDIVEQSIELGDNDELRAILAEVCTLTGMGFAAVAASASLQIQTD